MRDCVAIVLNFANFGRSDTQSNMKAPDIGIDDQGQLIFRLRKVKGRSKKKTNLTFQWPAGCKPDAAVAAGPAFCCTPARIDQSVGGAIECGSWAHPA
jgi:hypothetical protein